MKLRKKEVEMDLIKETLWGLGLACTMLIIIALVFCL